MIKISLAVLLLLLLLLLRSMYVSKYHLEVTKETVSCDGLIAPVRVVQLTDLHNSTFGTDNAELVQQVAEQQPDLIFLTGDLLNQDEEDTSVAVQLIAALSRLAPVYCSMGNHEEVYEQNYSTDVTALYEQAGAVMLDRSYVDIAVGEQTLRIGGIYGYCVPADSESAKTREEETAFLTEFQDTDVPTLLLCHMPVAWINYGSLDSWDIDVVFAGHAHGGQIRLPVLGGLYAPDQGFFVGRESGLYFSQDGASTLVLSRGLGSANAVPRINNIPEILVAELVSAQAD